MEDDLFDASLDQELCALIAGEHSHVQLLHTHGHSCQQSLYAHGLSRLSTADPPIDICCIALFQSVVPIHHHVLGCCST